jgi:DNA topoisomerase-1
LKAIEKLLRDGLRRRGSASTGFRWVTPAGRPVPRADLDRLRALRLPPAWTDVFASPAPGAKLQAIGRDRAGRWQYRYHPEFVRRRAAAKYRRLLRFAAALPRIRAAVRRDMRRRDLSRERVLAAMVRILEGCCMRPGSEAYARENRSFGLTTLRPRHVRLEGDRVVFDYRGKSGQRQVRALTDRRVAPLVRALLRVQGRDVFKFLEDGAVVDVRRRHLNAYLRQAAGAPFTAKDFRTWAGTLLCASELARRHPEAMQASRAARKRLVTEAVKAVADRLGNTPAVARSSYISPAVLDGFDRGRVIGCCLEPDGVIGDHAAALHGAERELLALLRAAAPSRRSAAPLRILRGTGQGTTPPRATQPSGSTAKPLRRAARGIDG